MNSASTGHMSLCVSPETKRGKEEEPRLSAPNGPMLQFLNLRRPSPSRC